MAVSFKEMSADAFERLARRLVEREFAHLPDDAKELPFVGGHPFCYYDRAAQKEVVLQALRAMRWAESELPPWMLPLPLTAEACSALFNRPHGNDYRANCRADLRGRYGMYLRSGAWDLTYVKPFEEFCAG
jgi:hypothetical protein